MDANDFSKYIGARIKMKRKKLGLSISKLAEMLELSYQQVQKYEAGHSKISAEKLAIIAYALNEPISYFYDDINLAHASIGCNIHDHIIPTERRHKMNILLIEDNPSDVLLFKDVAERTGYCEEIQVEYRANHVHAMLTQALNQQPYMPLPDMVFLDIGLSNGSGMEVLESIKSDPALQHLIVIIISGSVEREAMKRCYELGAASYILKSNQSQAFHKCLLQVLDYWHECVATPYI